MSMGRASANGVDFAYLEAGDPAGPLALCLHGFPDHAPTYSGLLPALADAGYHAVAPWMRGYAPTSVPEDGRYQTAALALDALALADALAPGREAVLIGHDWGAGAAYVAVAHQPERFSKLVTLAVPPFGAMTAFLTTPEQLKRSWYMFFFQSPLAEPAVSANDYAFIDMLWRDWSPGYTPDPGFMRALKDTFASPGSLEAAIGYYRAMFDPSKQVPELNEVQGKAAQPVPVPGLYLHGTDDGCLAAGMFTNSSVRACYTSDVEIELVEGTGHFLHLEKPDEVNARIVDFLG